MRVESNNSGLVRLGNVGKHNVDHTNQHSVFLRVSSVLDDRNDIRSLLGHTDQLSSWSVRKLNSIHNTFWSDNVSNVRNRGTGSCSQIENFLAWSNEQLVQTTHNTSSKLRSEWIPNSVLHLGCWGGLVLGWLVDGYSLFTVNRLSCCQVLGHKQILLSSGNVNSVVSVWFDYHLGAGTTFASASTASSSTGSSTSSTSSTSTTTGTTTSSKRTATSAKRTATGSSSGSPSESTTTSSAAASAASV